MAVSVSVWMVVYMVTKKYLRLMPWNRQGSARFLPCRRGGAITALLRSAENEAIFIGVFVWDSVGGWQCKNAESKWTLMNRTGGDFSRLNEEIGSLAAVRGRASSTES